MGHLIQKVQVRDINDTIAIAHKDNSLHYSLLGFTIHIGVHFCMRVMQGDVWYSYDGMEILKLDKLKDKQINFIGRVNSIVYVLKNTTKNNSS